MNDVEIKSLKGKTVLVTGSGKGLGSAIAVEAARQGAKVAVHYRSSEKNAHEVYEAVRAFGCPCTLIRADLSSPQEAEHLYGETVSALGEIDILVNNAALQYNLDFSDYSPDQVRMIFQVNLGGYLRMCQQVLPHMRQKGWGRIINISSVHAKRPTTFDFCYSMSKGAIKMLTRELALECGGTGITVNSLELGAVEIGVKSGNPQSVITGEQEKLAPLFTYRPEPPWGRIIQPEQIAPAVMFLASDGADCINGAALRMDDAAMLL